MTEVQTDVVVDNTWLTSKFQVNAWGEIVYLSGYPKSGLDRVTFYGGNRHLEPVRALFEGSVRGDQQFKPANWDMLENYAHSVFLARAGEAGKEQAEEALATYKVEVRDALLEAWRNGHKSHITRDSLNDFLVSIDLERADRQINSAYVEVTVRIALGESTLPDGQDLDEHLKSEAQEQINYSGYNSFEVEEIEVMEVEYDD